MLTDVKAGVQYELTTVSQCTFWCRVLTDAIKAGKDIDPFVSQCTFWCRVLTDGDGC